MLIIHLIYTKLFARSTQHHNLFSGTVVPTSSQVCDLGDIGPLRSLPLTEDNSVFGE